MELTHDFTVPAPIDTTWATFMDLHKVGSCFPGAVVTDASDDGFAGTVKVKLGPIALQYAGAGTFLERDDEGYRAVIEAKGKDKRGNGTAGATVTIQLAPSGEGTRVDVTTDLSVTGKPAQFGRGVMQDVSDKLLGQFVACIEQQFAVADEPEPPPVPQPEGGTPDAGPSAPSAAAGEAGSAGGGTASRSGAVGQSVGTASPGTTGGLAPAASRPAGGSTPRLAPVPQADDSIDLGATVLPVLLKTYAPHAVAGLIGVLIGWLIARRRT
ncbi:SRPBCC family protein [Ornithinibacter aureus]|uniref:SRPBCC family protein n=1 Tax=Ornithinibacter aureus TaxID=622664 RepID=A0ABP8JIV4_9MICO|nr:SRPBCC family protein [Ornithinibacter aureus]KAF0833775.1 carbon monoxide dehydrogenase subunit G [Ornithinibacter aureus]